MLTASIASPARDGVATTSFKTRLKVRTYNQPRFGRAILTGQVVVLAALILMAVHSWEAAGLLVLAAACQMCFHLNDLDRALVAVQRSEFWVTLLESVSIGFLTAAILFQTFPALVPRLGLAFVTALAMVVIPSIARLVVREMIRHGRCLETILIVGTGDLAEKLYHSVQVDTGVRLSERLSDDGDDVAGRGQIVEFSELSALVAKHKAPRVVIAESDPLSREKLAAALLDARLRGLWVTDAVDFYEQLTGKIWLEGLAPQWFLYTNGFRGSRVGLCIKRCFDVASALFLIVLTSPVLALIAVAIKLDSVGPVLFKQVRVGLDGQIFVIYKFRSMRVNSELEASPSWTAEHDERVTRVGRLLRIFRLDELPQAFNVLKGDMSMVGPRPERPCFVEWLRQTIPFYDSRHYLKPGITGWAQVMFTYGASVEDSYEKLQYDLYYAKHRSFSCEVGILVRTVRTVLFGRGR